MMEKEIVSEPPEPVTLIINGKTVKGPVSETLTLNGINPVTTVNSYLSAVVHDEDCEPKHRGTITIQKESPDGQ